MCITGLENITITTTTNNNNNNNNTTTAEKYRLGGMANLPYVKLRINEDGVFRR